MLHQSEPQRKVYFQHIYQSVSIEENTVNLTQTRPIVATRIAIVGKSINEQNEIRDLDAAMKCINATLVNRIGSISLKH